jgi:hypothetical protein
MDEMSDGYADDVYGDTDTNNLPVGQAGQDTNAGDGLPGYPVDGHPAWRAGMLGSGGGLLGMAQVSDPAAQPAGDDQAPFAEYGDPRLMRASDPVLDWEQNSWRWNDPEAIAYDLDRKKRQLEEANFLATAGGLVGYGQGKLDKYKSSTGIGVGSSPAARAAVGGVTAYMHFMETPRLQNEIEVLQTRLNQIRPQT